MMNNHKNLFNTLKYIFISGISKGLTYLLLFVFALKFSSSDYINLLLLISFEQFLNIILPLNNTNIIYSEKIHDYQTITNKLTSSSILLVIFFVFTYYFTGSYIADYFNNSNYLLYLSIFINVFFNGYFTYLISLLKIKEKHSAALHVQSLYFIIFISIIISLFIFNNKLFAYFVGKTFGFILMLVIVKYLKLNPVNNFRFKRLNTRETKIIINLISIGILGWISGLGFMNLAKIYASGDILIRLGYILNIWNVFLLISIGINSVYFPKVKKHIINNNLKVAISIKFKMLAIYLAISLLFYILYLIYKSSGLLEINSNDKLNDIILEFPNAILLFALTSFYYTINPFYLIKDKFATFNILIIISFIFWALVILLCSFFNMSNFILFLILLYAIKSITLYLFGFKYILKLHD